MAEKENENGAKRLNLYLPSEIAASLERAADVKGTNTQSLIRRFIILGLTALELEASPEDGLIIRKDGVERYITFF